MKNRRAFIKYSALGTAGLLTACSTQNDSTEQNNTEIKTPPAVRKPLAISTWYHGMAANKKAWETLAEGGSALDAVENGVKVTEADPENTSVGLGGLPDRDGNVTLDACIMDHQQRCGAVAYLKHIVHPISVARKVMEKTPHVMLVGDGALKFALQEGFEKSNLLTNKARKMWEDWQKNSEYQPEINRENHDTIGMLAIDQMGNLSGACTTSGMAYKMQGRVGDSPIIGAGLFVDNEIGAACATGVGEAVIRVAGSAMIVELMRNGATPQEACKEMVGRIVKTHSSRENLQVGFIALNKYGEYGGFAVKKGFNFALKSNDQDELIDAKFHE